MNRFWNAVSKAANTFHGRSLSKANRSSASIWIWGITERYYNKKREEFRAKQKGISDKISRLGFADEEYYLTSEYLLQLANRAHDLFISSEAEEKRQLLKLTLQNLRLEGKKSEFELVKPFDKVFACAGSQSWLPDEDSNLEPSG